MRKIKRTPYITLNYDDIDCINQLIQMARSKLSYVSRIQFCSTTSFVKY